LRANGIFKLPSKTYPSLILSEEDLAITQAAITKAAQAVAYLEAGQI
jgi:glutamate-1-semialdehyde 2,1-aminomutase